MKLNQLTALALLFSFIACSTPSSAPNAATVAEQQAAEKQETAKLIAMIPGFPAINSPEGKTDHKELLKLQKKRKAKDCERARSEVSPTLANLFGPPYGPLSLVEVLKLNSFFEEVSHETYHPNYLGKVKKNWSRPRPYDSYPDLHPCAKKETSFSYPSAHAAISRLYAKVLSQMYPRRAADFLSRADQIAQDRAISGVHYPTDLRDGKIIGDELYENMKMQDKFEKAIAPYLPVQ
jgi:acid phosphatase (class A)